MAFLATPDLASRQQKCTKNIIKPSYTKRRVEHETDDTQDLDKILAELEEDKSVEESPPTKEKPRQSEHDTEIVSDNYKDGDEIPEDAYFD